jgi:hypothetical protein
VVLRDRWVAAATPWADSGFLDCQTGSESGRPKRRVLAWHRVFSLALPAALQAGELLKLSDTHDPVKTARGEAHLTPRYAAIRHALENNSPLRALATATSRLFGAIVVVDEEYDTPPTLTFYQSEFPVVDLAATKMMIDEVLERLDELHDADYERERREEFEQLCAAVERGQALREPENRHV